MQVSGVYVNAVPTQRVKQKKKQTSTHSSND